MAHLIRLKKPFDTGEKVIPVDSVLALDRANMNRLVKEGAAFWCNAKGDPTFEGTPTVTEVLDNQTKNNKP